MSLESNWMGNRSGAPDAVGMGLNTDVGERGAKKEFLKQENLHQDYESEASVQPNFTRTRSYKVNFSVDLRYAGSMGI